MQSLKDAALRAASFLLRYGSRITSVASFSKSLLVLPGPYRLELNLQLDTTEHEREFAPATVEAAPSSSRLTRTLLHTRFWTVLTAIIALGSLVRVWAVFQYSPL